ncbi:MAG: MarR family transcriptional regulator [Cryomorphaceae bacterium]|nr:MarR family transcriptional regulator [Cryomorphaceae bacterium]
MKPEDTIDFQIKFAWQSVGRLYNEVAAKYESTWATGNVLLAIDLEEGTPSTALGPKMGMEATSLSRILKVLESKGLISRQTEKRDRRRVIVKLTPLGLEKREEAREAVLRFNAIMREKLGDKNFESLLENLKSVNDILSDGGISGKDLRS